MSVPTHVCPRLIMVQDGASSGKRIKSEWPVDQGPDILIWLVQNSEDSKSFKCKSVFQVVLKVYLSG